MAYRNFMNLKNTFSVCLLSGILLFAQFAFSQTKSYTLKGRVTDKDTHLPLEAASVFAQNTTIGVLTDSAGYFSITLPAGGYSLAITYTGYETGLLRVSHTSASVELHIELSPEEKSLDEIAIVFSAELKDGWEKYGDFFLKNFIGQTKYSTQCIIKNPEALRFFYYKKRRTLKVIAREPLIVENFALGYTLTFAIDSFVNNFNTRTSLFVGYPKFEEMTGTVAQRNIWLKNRFEIYNGSLLHFMRSLYAKKLQEDGYELKFIVRSATEEVPVTFRDPYSALRYKKDSSGLVSLDPSLDEVAVIYHRARPEVAYLILDHSSNKNFQISTLVFTRGKTTYLEPNGYFYDQVDMMTNGYLGFKKVADMLPYDYQPLQTSINTADRPKLHSERIDSTGTL